jgi:branched-chain amino acid transport system ATP-binding protein
MLEVSGFDVYYGTLQILRDVSVEVGNEIVGVLGPNGHGKTTLLKAISGLLRPKKGKAMFNGQEITNLPPDKIVGLGLIHIPQGDHLFTDMTVSENLLLGAYTPEAWKNRREKLKDVYRLFPVLEERGRQPASTLSGGERKMLSFGRGLMSGAKFLMIDEPTMGLAPHLTLEVFDAIKQIREKGLPMLIVEQNIRHVSGISDRLYLIENGRVVLHGKRDEVMNSAHLKEIYLGAS